MIIKYRVKLINKYEIIIYSEFVNNEMLWSVE